MLNCFIQKINKSSVALIATALFIFSLVFPVVAKGCTSVIVSAKASATGKPFLWKHRDTGTNQNFIEQVSDTGFKYIALFNGGDSLLREAWMGMNEAGFIIMNTASYNLAPDTAKFKDQEGIVMRKALESCQTIADFFTLLDTLPKPLGVQANFGVLDKYGDGGYIETNDYCYTPFLLTDSVPYLVRTNYSFSGEPGKGMGYIRYENALHLMKDEELTPSLFTEKLSRSFYHSLLNKDMMNESDEKWVIDQDFIPRYSSAASIVIEQGDENNKPTMYAVLGYPPVGELYKVTFYDLPTDLRPVAEGFCAPACNNSLKRKEMAFPITQGSGKHYINMDYLRSISKDLSIKNMNIYLNQSK